MISGNYSLIDKTAFAASTSRDASHLPANSRWYQGSMGKKLFYYISNCVRARCLLPNKEIYSSIV